MRLSASGVSTPTARDQGSKFEAASGCRQGEIRPRGSGERPLILGLAAAARQVATEAGLTATTSWSQQQTNSNLMEQLVQEVASPRTHGVLKEYYKQSKARPHLKVTAD